MVVLEVCWRFGDGRGGLVMVGVVWWWWRRFGDGGGGGGGLVMVVVVWWWWRFGDGGLVLEVW